MESALDQGHDQARLLSPPPALLVSQQHVSARAGILMDHDLEYQGRQTRIRVELPLTIVEHQTRIARSLVRPVALGTRSLPGFLERSEQLCRPAVTVFELPDTVYGPVGLWRRTRPNARCIISSALQSHSRL